MGKEEKATTGGYSDVDVKCESHFGAACAATDVLKMTFLAV